jgi:predicted Fe-Mo cluster-binding NifX family protein
MINTTTKGSNESTIRIALPVADGRLHGHFGGCHEFALVDADPQNRLVLATQFMSAPPHQPGLFPRWLRDLGVQVVIAGGIGRRALAIFAQHGIAVRAGTAETRVEALIAAYLAGHLTESPDGCEHHGHQHDHEQGHSHNEH